MRRVERAREREQRAARGGRAAARALGREQTLVPREHALMVVRNLHAHNCVGIVLSWSHPPYGGCGHVNNHHTPYLVSLFAELGYVYDADVSNLLRQRHTRTPANKLAWQPLNTSEHAGLGGPYYWFRESIYVLRRAERLTGPGCTKPHGANTG